MVKRKNVIIAMLLLLLCVGAVSAAVPTFTYLSDSVSWFKDKVGIGTDSPAAELEVENSDTGTAVLIDQDGNGVGLNIDSEASSEQSISVNAQFTGSSGKSVLQVRNDAAQTSGRALASFIQNSASSTVYSVEIQNGGTGNGLFVDQNNNGVALNIDSEAATARHLNVEAGSAFTGISMVNFNLDNPSSDGNVLNIRNDGTGVGLVIDQNGNGKALNILNDGSSSSIGIGQNGNYCDFYVDADGTCDSGTALGVDSGVAFCMNC